MLCRALLAMLAFLVWHAVAATPNNDNPLVGNVTASIWNDTHYKKNVHVDPGNNKHLEAAQACFEANVHTTRANPPTATHEPSALIINQLNLNTYPNIVKNITVFEQWCPQDRILFVHTSAIESNFYAFNSATFRCRRNTPSPVWFLSYGGSFNTAEETEVFITIGPPFVNDTSPSDSVWLLLTALGVGREVGAITGSSLSSFPSAMNQFDQGIESFVKALNALASAFGHHSKSAIIGRDACLGFDKFSEQTQVNVIECIPDTQIGTFVEEYFHDLAFAFGGDMEKVKAELLAWKYASATNFTYDGMQLTNTNTSKVRLLKVFKNHDDKLPCSHWIIVDFASNFTLAPDTIYWEKSSSSWFGFDTKDEEYTQKVPHKISLNDVEALNILFEIIAYSQLAEARGIPFTYPKLPNCTTASVNGTSMMTYLDGIYRNDDVVETTSVASAMDTLAKRELDVPAPPNWQTLMNEPTTLFFGNVNATPVSTPSSIERYVAKWPCDVKAYVYKALARFINSTAKSDRYRGEAFNLTVAQGHLATVLVVAHATTVPGVYSVWSFGMNTSATLVQQTKQVPYRHCWHCKKCLWTHDCCCETKEKTVPRPMTLQEVEDVYQRMRAQQYWYWTKHRPVLEQLSFTWQWASTPWSNCTKACGGGTESRTVYCISSDGKVDPTGTKCDPKAKPAMEEACNEVPCSGQYLIKCMKNQTDNLLKTLPSTAPPGASAVVHNEVSSGNHDVVSVPPTQVSTVLNSWTVSNQWPMNVSAHFQGIASGAASSHYVGFTFAYGKTQGDWTVVIGAARNYNGTIDMAYTSADGTGELIQQHYGNEKKIDCGSRSFTDYGISCGTDCRTTQSPCGNAARCADGSPCGPGEKCACPPCVCTSARPLPSPRSVEGKFGCATMLGAGDLQVEASGVTSPPYCYLMASFECACHGEPSTVWLDFSGCRNPATLAQCNKPLTEAQAETVKQALEFKARPQLPSQLDLLAIRLKQPPPYPQ